MREIKETDLNQSIRIEMTLKELDIVRLCLSIADSNDLKSGFRIISGNPRQFNYRDESANCAYLHS